MSAKRKARKPAKLPPPGSQWRILANAPKGGRFEIHSADYRGHETPKLTERMIFDELVIHDWLHLEQMDRSVWWLRVGEMRIWITVGRDGKAKRITVEEFGNDPKPRVP